MEIKTILNAFSGANILREVCITSRSKGNRGIAIEKDYYALQFQRRDRQVTRFYYRLSQMLADLTADRDRLAAQCRGAENHIGDLLTVQAQLVEALKAAMKTFEYIEDNTSDAGEINHAAHDGGYAVECAIAAAKSPAPPPDVPLSGAEE